MKNWKGKMKNEEWRIDNVTFDYRTTQSQACCCAAVLCNILYVPCTHTISHSGYM